MSQSLSKIYVHLVFSTKNRECYLTGDVGIKTYEYIGGILSNLGCKPEIVGGERDHIHALFNLSKTYSIADVVREVKTSSTKWFKITTVHSFGWQNGYGAFSVSQSQLEIVKNYIKNQDEHHRHRSFQEEFIEFLKAYDIEYDEKYVWD